jgi:hypothetical protein
MVEELSDQDDPLTAANGFDNFFGRFTAKLRPEDVLKILFAQKIEPVLTDAAQQGVQKARGEGAVGGVGKRPRQRHPGHPGATRPALGKALRVPSEKPDRAQRTHFEQRTFDAPVGHLARFCRASAYRIGWKSRHARSDDSKAHATRISPRSPTLRCCTFSLNDLERILSPHLPPHPVVAPAEAGPGCMGKCKSSILRGF